MINRPSLISASHVPSPSADAVAALRRRASYASVGVAATLILAKLGAYLVTGSISLLSSLIDSTTDLLSSLITLWAVHTALRPPDAHHRFGHGKAEPLGALAQAAFVCGSAAFLIIEAVERLLAPRPIESSAVGIAVMVFACVATYALVAFQRHVIRKTGSVAIGADRLHYVGDLLMNAAVIAALVLTDLTGWIATDSLFAFLIVAVLGRGAWLIGTQALDMLMDRELSAGERETITTIVRAHPAVRDLHDLRTRAAGTDVFIELHLELDGRLTLAAVHDITDTIEAALMTAYPGAAVIIHQEPAGVDDPRLDQRVAETENGGEY